MNEDYYVYKNYNSGVYIGNRTENDCIVGYDALTNKYVAMLDDGIGIVGNVYSKEEVNQMVDDLDEKIGVNSTSINSLTSVINTNKSNIETIQSELDKYALQLDLEETNSNVSNINTQVNTNKDDITSIKTQLENMVTTNNIESLNTLINENKNNISTNATNITNLQNSLGNYALQSELDTLKNNDLTANTLVYKKRFSIKAETVEDFLLQFVRLCIAEGVEYEEKIRFFATWEGYTYFEILCTLISGENLLFEAVSPHHNFRGIYSYSSDSFLVLDQLATQSQFDDINTSLLYKLDVVNPTYQGYLYNNFLTTENKQVIGSDGEKGIYLGNPELETLNLEYGGVSIPVADLAQKKDLRPVKIFDINSNSYGAGQTLGSSIDMSLYSGFVVEYSYSQHGYRKTSTFIGNMKADFQWLDLTYLDGGLYTAGVQVRSTGLFIETVGHTPPYLVALYGIPA